MKILRNLLFFLFIAVSIYPQQLGIWKNYSSLQKINDAYVTEKGLWAVCLGGAFYYNFEDGSYSILNKAEGLSNNRLTTVTVDPQGKVWIGSEDGTIDVYSPSSKEFKRILEIKNTNRINKNINELYSRNDTIFASTEFGLSLINSNNYSFYESATKFGNFTLDTKVLSSFKDNVVFACTQAGIAVQKPNSTNFSAPESWNTYFVSSSILADSVNKILKYRDTLVAATNRGLYFFNGSTWLLKTSALPSSYIDLYSRNDSLYLITKEQSLVLYSKGVISAPYPGTIYKKFAGNSSGDDIYVITDSGILSLKKGTNFLPPNGPRANLFSDMAVDKSGNLYIASGTDRVLLGYYKFDGSNWTNFSTANNPKLEYNAIYKTYVSPDNALYLGTWGNGFIKITDKDTTVFNASNTGMVGIEKNPNAIVIDGVKIDTKGNLWVLNYQSSQRQPFSKLSTDNVWTHYQDPLEVKEFLASGGLVIDNNDTKWFFVNNNTEAPPPIGGTLCYFNADNPLYSSDLNGWGRITSDDGLSNSAVYSLALGKRGELWVGMADGVNIIDDPSNPKKGITKVLIMRSQMVHSIAVDALNQKWVGTDKGVFVLSSDGTQLVANYTAENSQLPSNTVNLIAIDNKSGIVYMATSEGLASITTNSVNPSENLGNMYAYPNPVLLDKGQPANINISGLVRDSQIKIFTVSGKMITNFASPGAGIATWDGRDDSGNLVASGVYLIVAYDTEGNNVGTAKVAIIRK